MDSARWDRIQSLFHDVADRPAPERRVVLESACGDDLALIAEVLALLDADARTSLLDRDVASVARDIVGTRRPRPRVTRRPSRPA
jgi:hypothetical protein